MSVPPISSIRGTALAGLLAILALVAIVPVAQAEAGHIDRSFGEHGVASTPLGSSFTANTFQTVEAAPGGRLRMLSFQPILNWGFVSYTPGGKLEAETAPPGQEPLSNRVAAPDGAVIEYGYSSAAKGTVLKRRQPNGQLDPSFGVGGELAVTVPVEKIVPLPSGKLILIGTTVYRETLGTKPIREMEGILTRLEADGRTDLSFGGDSSLRLWTDDGVDYQYPVDVAPRAGEGLVVAFQGGSLAALGASGALDPSFGSGGKATVKGSIVEINAAAEGKVLVAGSVASDEPCFEQCDEDFFVARLTAAGQPDAGYGAGGTTRIDFGGSDEAKSVLWGADGSALLGGGSAELGIACGQFPLCVETPVLARVSAGGLAEPGFGSDGRLRLESLTEPIAGWVWSARGVLALAAGPAGGAYAAGGSGTTAFVAALDASGSPVAGFGDAGIVTSKLPKPSSSQALDVAVDNRERILVTGESDSGLETGSEMGAVFRYRRDGSLDHSYGDGKGFARLPFPGHRIVLDRRGRALVLGGFFDPAVARLLPSGALDQSFGREGIVQLEPKRAERMHVTAVAAQPDGKVLVAGINGVLHEKVVVFRLRQNGSLDGSFGKRGRVVVRFRDSKRLNGARQLLVEPDGHVLVAGFVMMKGDWRQKDSTMALLRLGPNGRVDRHFGRGGWVVPPVGAYSEATGLALQGGMILLAGLAELHRGRTATVLLRYRRDGTLDQSFGRRGQVRSAGPGRAGHIEWETARVLPTRQRLLLVHGGIARPVLAYTPNGKPLPGYARGAKLVPGRTTAKYLLYGPAGALQGGRPVLAWNAGIPAGGKKIRTTVRLQRLSR